MSDLNLLEALEVTTQEIKEYIDENYIAHNGEQSLNTNEKIAAKHNIGVYVQPGEPTNAVNGDVWFDTDDNETGVMSGVVKTINGMVPDENGNVDISFSSVELDDTLSVEGQAADAKAVGDALSGVVKTINGIDPDENGNVDVDTPSIALDTTLSVSGQAADSKVVGDAIKALEERISNMSVSGGGNTMTVAGTMENLNSVEMLDNMEMSVFGCLYEEE